MAHNNLIHLDYELLDSGDGHRVERFGNNIIARPESIAIWKSQKPLSAWKCQAVATQKARGEVAWKKTSLREPWVVSCGSFAMHLKCSLTKNIGIFPEQETNWRWLQQTIGHAKREVSVLNLFGYTGGATLAAAAVGARVCHVDAAASAVSWAKQNQALSDLQEKPIRWIVDDCIKFLQREIKRGVRYDGIILDPPAFGRSDNKIFKFERDGAFLLSLCKQVLAKEPLFFLMNCYAMNYSPLVARNLVQDIFPTLSLEDDELIIYETKRGYALSCGTYVRYRTAK